MSAPKDRVALVTGSSRGIGAAIAITFAEAGARVVLHGRDKAALASVRARITDIGGHATSVTGDVTSAADLAQMRERIVDGYGHLVCLSPMPAARAAVPRRSRTSPRRAGAPI